MLFRSQVLRHRHAEVEMLGASEIEAVRRQRPRIVVVGVEAGVLKLVAPDVPKLVAQHSQLVTWEQVQSQ